MRSLHAPAVFLAVALGWLGANGCTGDGSSGSFNPQSVPTDKPIEDLDPAEQREFCEEAKQWVGDFLGDTLPRLLCRTQGISGGSTASGFDVAACQAAERECLAQPAEDDEFDADEFTCDFSELDIECDATVGEFAECFNQAASLSKRLLSDLTCEGVASGNLPNEADYELSAACQALLDRCGSDASDETDNNGESGGSSDGGSAESTGGDETATSG